MQERAPEFIRVKMTGVKTQKRQKANVTIVRVGAKATVLKVERSKTGLKEGDAIRIVYTIKVRKRPVPGPRPLRLVKKGKEYTAFLKQKQGKTYVPAAMGESFTVLSTRSNQDDENEN
jgi:hypothetical protein